VSFDEDIADDVRRAIASLVDSLDGLETLIFLSRNGDRSFAVDDVVAAIGISPAGATRELDKMVARSLAVRDGERYRFQPASEELSGEVGLITRAYGVQRIAVINHVASRALQRIRDLADAFRLGKGKKDG
jgi:hypothetical protein